MLACVETRAFLHFAHPELNLSFVFASVFAVSGVYQQEMRQLASYTVQKMLSSPCRIVFFGVFLCVSHSASVVYGVFAGSRFAHATLDLHLCFSSVPGVGGGWGG